MSPSRMAHLCGNSGCPTLVSGSSHCPEHTVTREQRNPKDPAQAKFYGSTQWKKIRAIVKARDPICKICHRAPTTQADHIDDNWENNDLEGNLQGVCTDCHNTKSGRQHYWRKVPMKPKLEPFVILGGQAGVGKSTIRRHLAPMLEAEELGPDDYDGDWREVYEHLDRSPHAIVECCIVPDRLWRTAKQRGAFVVHITLPPHLRKQRLNRRGYPPETVTMLMNQHSRIGYDQPVRADITIDSSGDPKQAAQTIVLELKARGGHQ